jgi:hypothetical protein
MFGHRRILNVVRPLALCWMLVFAPSVAAQQTTNAPNDTLDLEKEILAVSQGLEKDLQNYLAKLNDARDAPERAALEYKEMLATVQRVLAAYGEGSELRKTAEAVAQTIDRQYADAQKRYRETNQKIWLDFQKDWDEQRVILRDHVIILDRYVREAERARAAIEANQPVFEHQQALGEVQKAVAAFGEAVGRMGTLTTKLGELVKQVSGTGREVQSGAAG